MLGTTNRLISARRGRRPRPRGQAFPQRGQVFPQRGQVFPLSLLFVGLVASLVFFFGKYALDINRTHHRQNLADSAALSAATWRARALNFNAFANRALIAQEVYAAHLTEANAWARYAARLAQRGQELAQIFPAAQPVAESIAQVVAVNEEVLSQLSELELFTRTAPGIGLNDQLMMAQYAFLRSADGFGLSAIANEIVRAADSDAFAHIVAGDRFSQSWSSVETEASKAQRRALAWQSLKGQSTMASTSEHPPTIDHRIEDQMAPIPTINCIPRSLKQLTARLVRESSLEQLDSGWRSSQTLSLHAWRRGRLLPTCGDQYELSAIAWSERVTSKQENQPEGVAGDGLQEMQHGIVWQNGNAQRSAQADSVALKGYAGAGRLTRVDTQSLQSLRHPLRVLVSVQTGRPRHPGHAYGAAWVFHHDPQLELASPLSYWLFPNWQARLSVPKRDEIEFADREASKP